MTAYKVVEASFECRLMARVSDAGLLTKLGTHTEPWWPASESLQ
jgi:hypothetical protein